MSVVAIDVGLKSIGVATLIAGVAVHRVEAPPAVADDELAAAELDRLHAARRNLGGLDRLDKLA